jgi:hypothetical protein|nr:lamin tail domain-containing protein [Kofleriaceae bacterium]
MATGSTYLTLLATVVAAAMAACATGAPEAGSDAARDAGTDAAHDAASDAAIDAAIDATPPAPFDVASAQSTGPLALTVTFDAPPDPTAAVALANYSVPGLALSGAPVLAGATVTLATSAQLAQTYTLTVADVARASDRQPLATATADFTGTAAALPAVTAVTVTATNPDNGAIAFDTGTATVAITGTSFATAICPGGVALDDVDGSGATVASHPTTCSIDSDTQITATFPAGIRTNGAAGWNVRVTNATGTNATSDQPFVPRAGVVVSEVYPGTSGNASHEFVELYNPTAQPVDGTQLHLHARTSTGSDADKTLTAVTAGQIAPRGFFLFASSASDGSDAWTAHADATYSDALAGNGGVYVSLSATANAQVIDKVGWGTQPAPGFEGAATANIPASQSVSRKPGGGAGHAVDSDDNASDFDAPSAAITPHGTGDPAEPLPTFDVSAAASPSPIAVTITFDGPPDPVAAADATNYAIDGGLTVSAASVAGNTVTLATSPQQATGYSVTVSNVARAFDALPLTTSTAQFTGTPVLPPTVTTVAVTATSPDNGTTPFDTGTATVTITGTELDTVACPAGVTLDDLDGSGAAVHTAAASCHVDSDTQITATFPAGIRTNGATGWNVIVTNTVAANTTSSVRFVPRAGVLVSEVYVGTSGNANHEFVELYNPTGAVVDGTKLHLHLRSSTGTDSGKTLAFVTAAQIPAHGFLLYASSVSDAGDAWTAHADATYSAALASDGGVYVSLSASANAQVIDKLGWGAQPAPGFETAAITNIPASDSAQRLPANGSGDATDSDDNANDFAAASPQITPLGTIDPPQP